MPRAAAIVRAYVSGSLTDRDALLAGAYIEPLTLPVTYDEAAAAVTELSAVIKGLAELTAIVWDDRRGLPGEPMDWAGFDAWLRDLLAGWASPPASG